MKILLGGVPFGCNNVGDEAILECSVSIIRQLAPNASITVSTRDEKATAAKLGVQTVELFGFDFPYDQNAMRKALQEHDAFVWCGATGLSDYPEIPLQMLRIAREAGRKTVLWGVGMNSVLNPAKYKVAPGKRRALLSAATALTFGAFDGIAFEERRRDRWVRGLIAEGLNSAGLIIVRDAPSAEEMRRSGVTREIVLGADSALILEPSPLESIKLSPAIRTRLEGPRRKIGICISTAAPRLKNVSGLAAWLDRLAALDNCDLFFVPMDPIEDLAFMSEIQGQMKLGSKTFMVEGRFEPAEILGIISKLNLIVTSRLHLLILSSIVSVPFAGISCGSKVDSFLAEHGMTAAGSVSDLDFNRLHEQSLELLGDAPAAIHRIQAARRKLLARLETGRSRFAAALAEKSPLPGAGLRS